MPTPPRSQRLRREGQRPSAVVADHVGEVLRLPALQTSEREGANASDQFSILDQDRTELASLIALGRFRAHVTGDMTPRQILILVEWESKRRTTNPHVRSPPGRAAPESSTSLLMEMARSCSPVACESGWLRVGRWW